MRGSTVSVSSLQKYGVSPSRSDRRADSSSTSMPQIGSMAIPLWVAIELHPATDSHYPQQPPDLTSGLASVGKAINFCRQWSLQK